MFLPEAARPKYDMIRGLRLPGLRKHPKWQKVIHSPIVLAACSNFSFARCFSVFDSIHLDIKE